VAQEQFLDAVAVAMITPGPVVITVVFIGYLAAGFLGAVMAAIGIFLPVYLFTIIPAPWFSRNRDNALLKAFVQGATAAATGALSGAVLVLASRAIYDVPTAAVALAVATFAILCGSRSRAHRVAGSRRPHRLAAGEVGERPPMASPHAACGRGRTPALPDEAFDIGIPAAGVV
jgi:hypothetical protein